jgi:hypothetical protein
MPIRIFNLFKCWFTVWILLGLVGLVVASYLVDFGISLQLTTGWDWLVAILIMPILETVVFNFWFQQNFYKWLSNKIHTLWLSYAITTLVVTFLFVLAHVNVTGILAWLWVFPGLVLVLLWFYCSSITLLSGVHAIWNLGLWWVS